MQRRALLATLFLAASAASCEAREGVVAAPAVSAQASVLTGQWRNERGSVLRVDEVGADGRITGAFRSAVGKVDAATWFPATGWLRGDVVGFVVAFDPAGSVSSWAGQLTVADGVEQLTTQWHLSRDVADTDETTGMWSSMLTGSDRFVRAPR